MMHYYMCWYTVSIEVKTEKEFQEEKKKFQK